MSQENVEIVRAAYRTYIAGDRDAYLDFFAEDVEARPDASFPEANPVRGREELKSFLAEIEADWEGGASGGVITEVFPVGDDRVVTVADWGGRGRASGIDVRSSLTSILTIRDGRIVKIEWFFDHAAALQAVGLSAQDAHADS